MKNSSQLKQIIAEAVSRQPKGRFLFLTLTVKNAYGAEELRSSLRVLTKAFNKLTRYKKVTKNLLGYLRSTEITVNDEDRSYNQHLHVLLFVKSSYFTGNNTNYIKQAEWTKLWQRALKVDYEPVVHVEIVKANKRKGTGSLQASAEETAKYEVKSSDYMTANDDRNLEVINDLEYALAGTRQISYGGLFKQIKQDLKLEDVDKGDLVHVGNEEYSKEQMEAAEEVVAKWDFKKQNYFMWQGVFFMMMRLDKFFVEEMQKNGFDVDFKRLKQIYLDSRNRHSDDIEKGKVRALNERLKYEDQEINEYGII